MFGGWLRCRFSLKRNKLGYRRRAGDRLCMAEVITQFRVASPQYSPELERQSS